MKRLLLILLLVLIGACGGPGGGSGKVYLPQFALPNGNSRVLVYSYPQLDYLDKIVAGSVAIRAARRPSGSELWVSCESSRDIAIVDTDRDTMMLRFNLGLAAQGGAFTPDGSFFVLAHGAQIDKRKNSALVSIVDAQTREIVATMDVGADPLSVAVSSDGREAYVANNGDDTLTHIDLVRRRVIDTVATGPGPYSLTVDPVEGILYVACRGVDKDEAGLFQRHRLPDLTQAGVLDSEMHPVQALVKGNALYLLEAGKLGEGRLRARDRSGEKELWDLDLPGQPGLGRISEDGAWMLLPAGGAELLCIDLAAGKIHRRRYLPDAAKAHFSIEVEIE